MALMTRSPVRNLAAPSTAPQEAMVTSLQKHIDELVQKNRASEHAIKKLQQELSDEKDRGMDAVTKIRLAAQKEREEWKEGCDSLLGVHRIVHLRTQIELNKAQTEQIKEREELRKEQLNVLVRDHRLTLFWVKESQLEAKVAELEDSLEEATKQYEQDAAEYVAYHEKTVAALNAQLKAETSRSNGAQAKLKLTSEQLEEAKTQLTELREEKTTLSATSATTATQLDRTSLQLDGAKTTIKELESTNGELQRTNADLKRQLDKWQSLDSKGGAQMEEMRKRKIELEVEVKELQVRVKELAKEAKDNAKALEKEQKRVEKLKSANDNMANLVTEAQDISERLKEELAQAEEELSKTRKLLEKLQLAKEKTSEAKGKGKAREIKPPSSSEDSNRVAGSEREVELAITPVAQQRVRPREAYQNPKHQEEAVSAAGSDEEPNGQMKTQRKRTATGPTRKRKEQRESESEQEEPEAPRPKARDKGKGKDTAPLESENEENIRVPSKAKGKGKEKAETVNKRATKAVKDASDSNDPPISKSKSQIQASRRKAASSQGSLQGRKGAEVEVDEGDHEAQPKKKKKKIFGAASKELTFPWGDLPKVDGGLGIPTDLSPIKEAAPPRSVFGKASSALKWGM